MHVTNSKSMPVAFKTYDPQWKGCNNYTWSPCFYSSIEG